MVKLEQSGWSAQGRRTNRLAKLNLSFSNLVFLTSFLFHRVKNKYSPKARRQVNGLPHQQTNKWQTDAIFFPMRNSEPLKINEAITVHLQLIYRNSLNR